MLKPEPIWLYHYRTLAETSLPISPPWPRRQGQSQHLPVPVASPAHLRAGKLHLRGSRPSPGSTNKRTDSSRCISMSRPEMLPPQVVALRAPGAKPPTSPQRFWSSSLQPSVRRVHSSTELTPPGAHPSLLCLVLPRQLQQWAGDTAGPHGSIKMTQSRGCDGGIGPEVLEKGRPHHSPPPDTPCTCPAPQTGRPHGLALGTLRKTSPQRQVEPWQDSGNWGKRDRQARQGHSTGTGRKGLWAGTGGRWGQCRAQKVEVTVGDLECRRRH